MLSLHHFFTSSFVARGALCRGDAFSFRYDFKAPFIPHFLLFTLPFTIVFRLRVKYHPEESQKIKDAHLANVQKRLEIFTALKDKGTFDNLNLDLENAKEIIRVMDTGTFRMKKVIETFL